MMGKRKSIGSDPLDWIGESANPSERLGSPEGLPKNALPGDADPPDKAGDDKDAPPGTRDSLLPISPQAAAFALERQLLLVDGLVRDGVPRPRFNQALWFLIFILGLMGMGIFFFREIRHQWVERISALQGTVDLLEKDKGRNERALEQVISEKDSIIQEKQGTIEKIRTLHQIAADELRLVRAESSKLREENHALIEKLLHAPGEVALEARSGEPARPDGPPGPSPQSSRPNETAK